MLRIQENISLKQFNSFGVDATARRLIEINKEEDLTELFSAGRLKKEISSDPHFILLGGGSNILFTKDIIDTTIIKMNIKGININHKEDGKIYLDVSGGEVWSDLVNFCVNNKYWGLENLSAIPGSAGASPVQNIGAYGVEIKDVFYSLRAFDTQNSDFKTFNARDCEFGYRSSIFKTKYKGRFIICSVKFLLSAEAAPNTRYGAIKAELDKRGIKNPEIKDISEVITYIRAEKLPDPKKVGNAGSFFKNPIIKADKFKELISEFPNLISFPGEDGMIKLSAAQLIEECDWKGKTIGSAGTWKNQALVLINNEGTASGAEIYEFSEKILISVREKFGIDLEREVNII